MTGRFAAIGRNLPAPRTEANWQISSAPAKYPRMDRARILAALRAHEIELRASGVEQLSIFGSTARGDVAANSDVDVVVRFDAEAAREGFAYFGRLAALGRRLDEIVGRPVDIVTEPVRKERLRRAIERDAVRVF